MQRPRKLGTTLLLGALLAVTGLVLAVGTDANTSITNVAAATYNDSAGNPQTTFSNPVTTLVQQVYSLTILPDGTEATPGQTESALPGATVSLNYIVTNTGNGDDTINLVTSQTLAGPADDFNLTGVTLYQDVGCDGSVAGDPVITSVDLSADESACVIVVGTIPVSAVDGDLGKINLEGTSAGDGTQTDTNNWSQAEANTGGNLTGNKSASPSGGVDAGGTLSYTISGSNNGGGPASGLATSYQASGDVATPTTGIVISDDVPANTSYVAASISASAGAGTAIPVVSDDGGTTWYEDEGDVVGTIDAVGLIIEGGAGFFPQSANYQLDFDVIVDALATAGSLIQNSADIAYSSDGVATDSTTTNTTSNTVNATYGAALGPEGEATSDGLASSTTYTDPVSGDTWNIDLTGGFTAGDDTQTVTDTVYTGDTVAFKHTLENTGNASDTFTIGAVSAQGYPVTLYQADGVTPLTGPIGPLAPGASQDIVVKVAIPVGATLADTVTVTATSVGDGIETDVSTDAIPAPLPGFGVDVAQLGESDDAEGDTDDTLGSDVPADPGDTLSFPIEVTNTGQQDDSYDLTPTVPAGWTVIFVEDANCDGTADGAAVTSTPLLDPGDTVCYVAQVTVPASAGPSDDNVVEVTATSNSDPTVTNTVSGTVDVNTVADLSFINDQVATTSPNSVVTYSHTVINDGNDTATMEIPAQGATTFTYQYAVDTDNDGDFSDETFYSELTTGNGQDFDVPAGGTQTVFVRVIVPDTATDGDEETVTVTATGTYPDTSTASDDVQDRTIVQAGELDLNKSAQTCADAACATVLDATGTTADPGDYLEYTVVASNIGAGDLTAVKISDPLPAFTDFVSASATTTVAGGTVLYSTDGTTWSTTAPGALAAGESIYVGVDTVIDTDVTADDVVAPAESITLTLVVQVQ